MAAVAAERARTRVLVAGAEGLTPEEPNINYGAMTISRLEVLGGTIAYAIHEPRADARGRPGAAPTWWPGAAPTWWPEWYSSAHSCGDRGAGPGTL